MTAPAVQLMPITCPSRDPHLDPGELGPHQTLRSIPTPLTWASPSQQALAMLWGHLEVTLEDTARLLQRPCCPRVGCPGMPTALRPCLPVPGAAARHSRAPGECAAGTVPGGGAPRLFPSPHSCPASGKLPPASFRGPSQPLHHASPQPRQAPPAPSVPDSWCPPLTWGLGGVPVTQKMWSWFTSSFSIFKSGNL